MKYILKFLYASIFGIYLLNADTTPAFAGNKIPANCKSNGKCCKKLNQFWQDRAMQDFKVGDSDYYPMTKRFSCPSPQSFWAEAFKFVHDFSHTKFSTRNHYSWLVEVLRDANYTFYIETLAHAAAETQHGFKAVVFGAKHIPKLTVPTAAGYILHEAVHVENPEGSKHFVCKGGTHEGVKGCDEKLGNDYSKNFGAFTTHLLFLIEARESLSRRDAARVAYSIKNAYVNFIDNPPKYGLDGKTPFLKYYRLQ